jgi:hypothetical protein
MRRGRGERRSVVGEGRKRDRVIIPVIYLYSSIPAVYLQGRAMNCGLLFAGPPPPPLGGCKRKD